MRTVSAGLLAIASLGVPALASAQVAPATVTTTPAVPATPATPPARPVATAPYAIAPEAPELPARAPVTRPVWGFVIAGATIFGSAHATMVVYGAELSARDGTNARLSVFPVVGPIAEAYRFANRTCSGIICFRVFDVMAAVYMASNAVAQVVGLGMLVGGLETRVPVGASRRTASPLRWAVTPMASQTTMGASLTVVGF